MEQTKETWQETDRLILKETRFIGQKEVDGRRVHFSPVMIHVSINISQYILQVYTFWLLFFSYLYVVAYELIERMSYYAIQSNLVSYLTNKLHQGTVEAANNVTNWVGAVFLTPILGAYIADAYLGQYWTFMIGSAIYQLVITD